RSARGHEPPALAPECPSRSATAPAPGPGARMPRPFRQGAVLTADAPPVPPPTRPPARAAEPPRGSASALQAPLAHALAAGEVGELGGEALVLAELVGEQGAAHGAQDGGVAHAVADREHAQGQHEQED